MITADEIYDGNPPAGIENPPQFDAADIVVGTIENHLYRAAQGGDPAWHISTALAALQNATARRDAARISDAQRDQLISALLDIRSALLALFPAPLERELARKGAEAAAGLVIWWSECADVREARHSHVHIDMHAYARILRNRCHDASLLTEIKARADARVKETVRGVLERAAA